MSGNQHDRGFEKLRGERGGITPPPGFENDAANDEEPEIVDEKQDIEVNNCEASMEESDDENNVEISEKETEYFDSKGF